MSVTLCTRADPAWLAQVAEARAVSEVLQERAGEAARHIARCSAKAGQAGAHFMTLALELVRVATQLPGPAGAAAAAAAGRRQAPARGRHQPLRAVQDRPGQLPYNNNNENVIISGQQAQIAATSSMLDEVQFGTLMTPPWLLISVMQ